jgi:hypothetical protein
MLNVLTEREKLMSDDYYTVYHATTPLVMFLSEILTMYYHMYYKKPLSTTSKVFRLENEIRDVNSFLSYQYSLPSNKHFNLDNNQEFTAIGMSVSPSLYSGNSGENSIGYFSEKDSATVSSQDINKLITSVVELFPFTDKRYIDVYIYKLKRHFKRYFSNHLNKNECINSVMYQIFIKKEKINDILYMSTAWGYKIDIDANEYFNNLQKGNNLQNLSLYDKVILDINKNIYSKIKSEDGDKIGDVFSKSLPVIYDLIDCVNVSYTNIALNKFKEYGIYLNDISIPQYFFTDTDNDVEYIKMLNSNIWSNISTKQYTSIPEVVNEIPRPNHGGLNHMRSLKFGLLVLKAILKSPKYNDYRHWFSSNTAFIMLICSLNFESIMRIDEIGSSDVVCGLDEDYFNKLYPTLNYEEYGQSKASSHQIASSVLYTILMQKCFGHLVDEFQIDEFSRGVSFYWDKNNPPPIEPEQKRVRFQTYYNIITSGHYLDHCRGPNSGWGGNLTYIESLFNVFGVSESDKIEIHKTIIRDLVNTEYESYNGDIDSINTIDMDKTCSQLQGRYGPKFVKYSNDFNSTWDILGLGDVIREVLDLRKKLHKTLNTYNQTAPPLSYLKNTKSKITEYFKKPDLQCRLVATATETFMSDDVHVYTVTKDTNGHINLDHLYDLQKIMMQIIEKCDKSFFNNIHLNRPDTPTTPNVTTQDV